ncbi:MAG: 4Fe-4S cluster-binding domain-containing protein, partial [Desulfamplus sp.]|nr:4Fe-4S cluster-binding domain-containing protein [Desulfamplus sp.]
PFAQAEHLARLCQLARKTCNLGVVCYSGWTRKELQNHSDRSVQALLAQVDILIDGPFVQQQAAPLLWRGSLNQTIHLLTDRYQTDILNHPPHMEIQVGPEESILLGMSNPKIECLFQALEKRGIFLGRS